MLQSERPRTGGGVPGASPVMFQCFFFLCYSKQRQAAFCLIYVPDT